jgi:hypothetical protein
MSRKKNERRTTVDFYVMFEEFISLNNRHIGEKSKVNRSHLNKATEKEYGELQDASKGETVRSCESESDGGGDVR